MLRNLSAVFAGLVLYSQLASAQFTTGTISGVVKDTSAAVIPGVSVVLRNLETGAARTVVTDEEGRYRAPNLPLGNYEVEAQLSGFRTEARRGIKLSVGQEAAVDFVLSLGEVTEQVTVTGEVPLVETTHSALSGLVDDKSIRDLPLNGRSFDQLVLLQVGTLEGRRMGSPSFLGGGAKISISGARPQQNSFWLDGTDVNDFRNTMPGSAAGVFLGVETVREFRVLTNSYTAEYGRSAGGVITAVTRSGTNDLHGTLFEFHRNSALDARNFFDPGPPPPFKRNQFGFTLGGPIRRDKTFFFGSYEGFRDRLGETLRAKVPNASARQGTIAPAVRPWLALYPLPNGDDFGDGTGEFIHSASRKTDEDYFIIRLDHALSSKHSVFGRYALDDADRNTPESIPFQSSLDESRNQYATLQLESILSAATLNAFRAGFNRTFPRANTVYEGLPSELTFVPGTPFEIGGLLDVSGMESIGNQRNPQWNAYNLFQWSDDLTHTRGSHTLKTGLIIQRIRLNLDSTNSGAGTYRFSGGLVDFLAGRPDQFLVLMPGFTRHRNWRQSLFGFYVQDDYRIRPRLTLNLGLREEFMTSPHEVHGKSANLVDVMLDWPIIGNPLFKTFKRNLAPRVGFAWDSLGSGRVVLRGGFGLFHDQPYATYWKSPGYSGGPPFTQLAQIDFPPFPNAFLTITPQNIRFGDIRPFKYTGTAYTMQYNLTVQSQIMSDMAVTIGYAGSQGRKLVRTGNMNIKVPVIQPDGRQFFPRNAPRRNPRWGDVRIEQTDANSNYNALVARVDKRFRGGLQFGGSYTFSKIMSDAETVFGADGVTGEHHVMDPYDPKLDRAPASFSEKHNFSFSYSYNLPLALSGAVGKVLNDWQVSGITRISSGAPFPARSQWGSDNGSRGSVITERPELPPGANKNPVLGGPDRYFDATVFVRAERGFYGNLGRNTLIAPGLVNFDFSLLKKTAITERANLQFRAEFFNLFNRPNFGTPANLIFNSRGDLQGNAGRITRTDTTSRQVQFALKLVF